MFTSGGLSVYTAGRKHTLEYQEHRLKATTTDDPGTPFNKQRLVRAAADVGVVCVWRYSRETEVMDIFF